MLRNGQLARIANALCIRSGLHPRGICWTSRGPSKEALAVEAGDFGCSSGEALIVQTAFAVWNNFNRKAAVLGDLLGTLSGCHLIAIGELLVAIGKAEEDQGAAVEAWLKSEEKRHATATEATAP